jgi:glycerol-3-phosphate dehydrogenase
MLPKARERSEGQSLSEVYDIVVIGGGVNGCGVARDAAGRGMKTLLCERGDLASATSSASTKLIHGGLRYLEHYAFHLVSHALAEREILWKIAPHIIWPMRFVLPYRKGLRPAWLLRLGLFLYDHIGGRKLLPATRTLRLNRDPLGDPLRDVSGIGFEYSDGWVQDARLVVLNARDARARGAEILVRTAFLAACKEGANWLVDLEDVETRARKSVTARAIVNAAGPWVAEALGHVSGAKRSAGVRLVQGSHIVVRKLYDHDRCYFFQNPDGRIFFAIPYEEDFTLIGTTDQDYQGDPAKAHASEAEIEYLCSAASSYFKQAVARKDVVWTYSGVRPLYDDGASAAKDATRDYVLTFEGGPGEPALLNVFGGKITTYRRLAEDALAKLAHVLPAAGRGAGWTAQAPLPGGDFFALRAEGLAAEFLCEYPFLDARRARRLVKHYGTEARRWLKPNLGRDFGGDLTEAEVGFLMDHEYARTAEDVVWRRTKSGLRMNAEQVAALEAWMKARRAALTAKA